MQGKLLRGLSLAAALSLTFTGCALLPTEEEFPVAPIVNTYEAKDYKLSVVKRGDLVLSDSLVCQYVPTKKESLSFSLGGEYVEGIYVNEGEHVKAGDLLAELVENSSTTQIETQEYQINVQKVKRKHLLQDETLELKRQDALIAEIDLKIDDTKRLLNALVAWEKAQQSASSDEQAASRPTEYTTAQLQQQILSLQNNKQTQQNQKEATKTSYAQRVKEIDDDLYIRELRLKALKEDYKKRQLYATIDGTVTFVREISDGYRTVKDALFITISDMSSTAFTASGEKTANFTIGEEVTIVKGKTEYTAIVTEASELGLPAQSEDEEPKAYFRLTTPDPTLENGDAARVTYVLDSREDVLYVEKKAIQTSNGNYFVYVLDENGLRARKDVTVGLETDTYIEITSGLQEGESIIL